MLPRPDLDQRTDHKASQKGNGLVVPVLEKPGKEVGEGQKTGYRTNQVESQARKVKGADALHKILVLDHQNQKETARDARQDHAADAGSTGNQNEPPGVRSLGRRSQRYPYGNGDTQRKAYKSAYVPDLYFLGDIPAGNQNQAKEESPGGNRMVVEKVEHKLGKGEGAYRDAQNDKKQEHNVRFLGPLLELALEQEFGGPEVERLEAVYQSLENAGQEGDCAAAYARNHVSGPDADAFKRPKYVVSNLSHWSMLLILRAVALVVAMS